MAPHRTGPGAAPASDTWTARPAPSRALADWRSYLVALVPSYTASVWPALRPDEGWQIDIEIRLAAPAEGRRQGGASAPGADNAAAS